MKGTNLSNWSIQQEIQKRVDYEDLVRWTETPKEEVGIVAPVRVTEKVPRPLMRRLVLQWLP